MHKAYTFKYPDEEDVTAAQISYIKEYLNAFETALWLPDRSYLDFIDAESFASWVMVHEYLGCYDAAGSNQFLMKRDDTPATKLEMTTTWDFDGIMFESDYGRSANMNRSGFFYSSWMLKKPSFVEFCKAKYAGSRDGIIQAVCDKIDALDCDAIDSARESDALRWRSGSFTVEQQKQAVESWLTERLEWMDTVYR